MFSESAMSVNNIPPKIFVNMCGFSRNPSAVSFRGQNLQDDIVDFKSFRLTNDDLTNWSEVVNQISKDNLKGLDSVSNLNNEELKELKKHLLAHKDIEPFLLVSTGSRPAMSTQKHPLLNKLDDNFEVVPFCNTSVMIFNKSKMLETIESNKDFFLKRLNLPEKFSNEEIYEAFISNDELLNDIAQVQDLIGISFGYPFKNTIIFQLERDSKMDANNITKQRKNIEEYKKQLLNTLYSNESKYANFDETFKSEIARAINSINEVRESTNCCYPKGYLFMKAVNEPTEEQRIAQCVRKSAIEIDKINNINQKEKQKQFFAEIEYIDDGRFNVSNFLEDLYNKYFD